MKHILLIILIFLFSSCSGIEGSSMEVQTVSKSVNDPNYKYFITFKRSDLLYYTNDSTFKPGDKVKIVKQ